MKICATKAYELSNTPPSCSNDLELQELTAYFSSGAFFYSENNNIASSFQNKDEKSKEFIEQRNATFVWNQHLLDPITDLASQIPLEHSSFLLEAEIFSKIAKGFFESTKKNISTKNYEVGVHTRIGKKKAGTRFNSRGLDDEGNVSIFAETEVIIS